MRVLSSSLYKDTTFSREIQIPLIFRNNPPNVKKTRFAAASLRHVLYYEAGSGEGQMGRRQMVECHGFAHGFRDCNEILNLTLLVTLSEIHKFAAWEHSI